MGPPVLGEGQWIRKICPTNVSNFVGRCNPDGMIGYVCYLLYVCIDIKGVHITRAHILVIERRLAEKLVKVHRERLFVTRAMKIFKFVARINAGLQGISIFDHGVSRYCK